MPETALAAFYIKQHGVKYRDAQGNGRRWGKLLFYQTFPGGTLVTHVYGLLPGEVCLFEDLQ